MKNASEPNAKTRQSGLNVLWARQKISQRTRNNNNDRFDVDQSSLTLITCYPFDSVMPYPTYIYFLRAIAI